jgi:hypothetical protein
MLGEGVDRTSFPIVHGGYVAQGANFSLSLRLTDGSCSNVHMPESRSSGAVPFERLRMSSSLFRPQAGEVGAR